MLKIPMFFYCKGDNFKLKQIHPSFVVSVGTNSRNLIKFISAWGMLLKVQKGNRKIKE